MKLSILLSVRKNSKFLAKFLHNYADKTRHWDEHELLIMYSEQDTWNKEIINDFDGIPSIHFFKEDYKLGRSGLHQYFNELARHATGEFLIYFCDDHHIAVRDWDVKLLDFIAENNIDSKKVNMIVPKWDNAGAMSQILSRGWYEAAGSIGRYGNIDSYNNFVAEKIDQERVHQMTEPLFHDFTHDPYIMTPEDCIVEDMQPILENWGDQSVTDRIQEDAEKLQEAIRNEV